MIHSCSYSSLFCTGAGMSSISSSPFKSPFFCYKQKVKAGVGGASVLGLSDLYDIEWIQELKKLISVKVRFTLQESKAHGKL